ncbi:hypothetical protein K7X08_018829 [Anisodus acutangulus]|uniref:Uncharacterized protein n=1 Tax=Anisodus acutangulus TaxID=402998 RepID=A0A9Q1LWE8_9SOLA|nr:hypothetical protein K7X08_018829 [Anisodus acutangulus]
MKGNRGTLQKHTNPGKDKKHRLLQKGWLWRTSRRSKGVIEPLLKHIKGRKNVKVYIYIYPDKVAYNAFSIIQA